jgi:hypothetical protein
MITGADMPNWLESYIYDTLQAPFFAHADFGAVGVLAFNRDQLLNYLGTYFPRSYAESFCIFTTLFENPRISRAVEQNESLNILVLGAGTGGDCLGLLTAIKNRFPQCGKNVFLYDGNEAALNICTDIFAQFPRQLGFLDTTSKCCNFREGFPNDGIKFDFIVSSKMFCELAMQGQKNMYYDFARQYLPMLSDSGICLMLDVTTPLQNLPNRAFAPKIMNEQITHALRSFEFSYRTLLPAPCRENEENCMLCNFISYEFQVHHRYSYRRDYRHDDGDRSQVIYRVLARKDFVAAAQIITDTPWWNSARILPCERRG